MDVQIGIYSLLKLTPSKTLEYAYCIRVKIWFRRRILFLKFSFQILSPKKSVSIRTYIGLNIQKENSFEDEKSSGCRQREFDAITAKVAVTFCVVIGDFLNYEIIPK